MDLLDFKKLKILGKLLIFTSKNKIHVKDLDMSDEHGTIGFLPNGTMDFHKKQEKDKKYTSLGILDPTKFLQKFVQNPMEYLLPLIEITKVMKTVNFNEKEYEHLTVEILPGKSALLDLLKNNGKEYSISKESFDDWSGKKEICKWFDCKDKSMEIALVYDGSRQVGIIYKVENGALVFIQINEETKSILDKLESTWIQLDKPTWKQD